MIAIFDIGKTNKKCFIFDEDYRIVFEKSAQLPETADEDGDPCEDIDLLTKWVLETWQEILKDKRYQVSAVNFTSYGASFVCIDEDGNPVLPLYNYLKPFPENLHKLFFETYGGEEKLSLETASPVLGCLNAGLQLYRLKYQRTLDFQKVKYALHLPQYLASLLHGRFFSDSTSIGCHTMLWNFAKRDYHDWVFAEGFDRLLAPIVPSDSNFQINKSANLKIHIGAGLHDSSAALIPYLKSFEQPFILISTGTWNISLNPFNQTPLTFEELSQDCLCYLSPGGNPVKAARLFAGHEHDQAIIRIAAQFGVDKDFYKNMGFTPTSAFERTYLKFMQQLIEKQAISTKLAMSGADINYIFADGGFSKNEIFLSLLAQAFPDKEVYAAELAQATALGAALLMHSHWNKKPMPKNLITLKKVSA